MNINKTALELCIADMPDPVDIDEVMYRLYLLEKIEAGEADIKAGRTISHEDLADRLARRWSA
ncbi:hypothetical protein [Geobacter argillaceus]|uniref:Uncharacterized protein n=1 Tax=Geobacter argillaceus TaxID=345631 RepID=A0A562WRN9_9BACT|nr:hypothetical protein [Geobacter argillaceus]TWJ32977.1 hypothetical protein JN12_00388 [Geobacter argillaceus]